MCKIVCIIGNHACSLGPLLAWPELANVRYSLSTVRYSRPRRIQNALYPVTDLTTWIQSLHALLLVTLEGFRKENE
jgi:hypothetical protein